MIFKRILSIFARRGAGKRHVRGMIRGYKMLRASGRLGVLALIKQELTETVLDVEPSAFAATIFGIALPSAELALRQYLLFRLAGGKINGALLRIAGTPRGKVVFPLPVHWQKILAKHGFPVGHWRCTLLWFGYVGLMLAHGVVQCLKTIAGGLSKREQPDKRGEGYAYFTDLTRRNIPDAANGLGHEIVSWYVGWSQRPAAIKSIRHGVHGVPDFSINSISIAYQRRPFPALCGLAEVGMFSVWALKAFLFASIELLRGRWWHPFLFSQAATSAQVRYLEADLLAKEYLFHNSSWIYRPLWTYEAEAKGADIALYFYSTNSEPFKRNYGYPPPYYGYRAMNWPGYLVWDTYQAEFVRRVAHIKPLASKIKIVGPISFSGRKVDLPRRGRSVALFDVTPFRMSEYCKLGFDFDYYLPKVAIGFVEDVYQAVRQLDGQILWKQKRDIGKGAHSLYRRRVALFDGDPVVQFIDPIVSAESVIEVADAVISMPFTSTALVAKKLGKPSAFYDPSGGLFPDDRAAHGIPVLLSQSQLYDWLVLHLGQSR